MFDALAARMRHSDVNYRLLIPLLASAAAVQAVTAIVRVTTSYRIVELGLPAVWLGSCRRHLRSCRCSSRSGSAASSTAAMMRWRPGSARH